MITIVFENLDSVMIQDRFIENLVIRGSVENYRQVGTKKSWTYSAESVLLEFNPDKEIITKGLKEEKDITKRLDMFSDITMLEIDGQTYFVPYKGVEVNIYQNVEYLPNGNIRITIRKD
jgi:hypothetical protein